MRIPLSPKERAVFVAIVGDSPSWGGDEASLLVRDEMYDAIELGWFEGRKMVLDELGDRPADYDVSPAVAQHMIATLCSARLIAALGRIAARVVRRLRAALERDAAKPALESVPPEPAP